MTYQRARQPEQKNERRQAILAAAAELFDADGPNGAGINAIAAKAGFTKSNVYRYFESREEVLLTLMMGELDGLTNEVSATLLACAVDDVDALAQAATKCFLAHPRLCALLSILSSTLEQNVSEAIVVEVKATMGAQLGNAVSALHARLPRASHEDCAWVISTTGALIAGMWPTAHPGPVTERVLARPEFAQLRPMPERDLQRSLRALLTSIV